MAEFGPKVFHALGMYADRDRNNSFKTAEPPEVGLVENDLTEEEAKAQIEAFKNALFKVVMFRARNALSSMRPEEAMALANDFSSEGIPVSLNMRLYVNAIHPKENATKAEKSNNSVLNVRGSRVDGIPGIDTPDIKAVLAKFQHMAMACGSGPKLDARLAKRFENGQATTEDDLVFSGLWEL